MSSSHPPTRSAWSLLLRLIVTTVSIIAVLALLVGIAVAAGEPDSPLLLTAILTPLVLALAAILIAEQRKQ